MAEPVMDDNVDGIDLIDDFHVCNKGRMVIRAKHYSEEQDRSHEKFRCTLAPEVQKRILKLRIIKQRRLCA